MKRIPESELIEFTPTEMLGEISSSWDYINRLERELAQLKKVVEQLRVCKEFKTSHGSGLLKENVKLKADNAKLVLQLKTLSGDNVYLLDERNALNKRMASLEERECRLVAKVVLYEKYSDTYAKARVERLFGAK